MAIPYPYITNNATHINTGSYLNTLESNMFISSFGTDIWYGFSGADVIEISVFDLEQNSIAWATTNTTKTYKEVSLSYLNTLDQRVDYSYKELQNDFILYKNSKILVNPVEDLQSAFNIFQGNYLVTYNFIRQMAGDPLNLLIIKDISPSRKEIKLTPVRGNDIRYEAFCRKKFLIKDVAPILLQLTSQCPYTDIYNTVKSKYSKEIDFLKSLLFLNTDGAFIAFLKTLYEDVVTYTNPSIEQIEKIKRTQGIKTYYQNFLLSNYEKISDFLEIDDYFDSIVKLRIEQQFKPYGIQTNPEFINSKQFLIEFFTTSFYHPITLSVKSTFEAKYFSYFKNAINLGNNQKCVILDHTFIDERKSSSDPLTLLLKLKDGIPNNIGIQTECWISNISIAPYVINAIFRKTSEKQTLKISPPNFTLDANTISLYNNNNQFSSTDLTPSIPDQQTIEVNKKINELSVDYTNFSNFIVFSSAEHRLSNFKTKVATWYSLSSSLETLNATASQFLLTGEYYPQYATERGIIESRMSEIITSFDGYESYLFDSGSYIYNSTTKTFYSSSYVEMQDYTASLFDKINKDSLVNNTPLHIITDPDNEEYITFLNMIGHYFDNIYLYISNLPSEKNIDNDPIKTFSKKMIDGMLSSFGWNIESSYEDQTSTQTYTSTANSSLSEENRIKSIRTRILNSLPQIYKTKGTEEAIRMLLSCHGIPSNLLDIREYGGNDFDSTDITYTKRERSCLIGISGSSLIKQTYSPRPNIRTVECKLAFTHPTQYIINSKYALINANHTYGIRWDAGWLTHSLLGPAEVTTSFNRGYYYLDNYPAWEIGCIREYGHMGRIYAKLAAYTSSIYNSGGTDYVYSGSKISFQNSSIYLTSSLFPIFDGNIFNIRLRRNEPEAAYQYVVNDELIPSVYDLTVQRNESGRNIFRSINSQIGKYEDNSVWDGISIMDEWESTGSIGTTNTSSIYWGDINGRKIYASIGNAMIWDVPISDSDFDIHCNDFSSFAYSGSEAEKHLITRIDSDEATNFLTSASAYVSNGTYISGFAYGIIPNKSEYYSVSSSTIKSVVPFPIEYTASNYYPLNPTASTVTCETQSIVSIYPYEYVIVDLEKTYTTPNYGPNRFKNEKVKRKHQILESRLDDKGKSTSATNDAIRSDSNLLGFYLDPQDAKNRDIVKFFGNNDVMELIADPLNMYSSSYKDLKISNDHYNSFGNRTVLYNELISLYKIYFNRSIFEAIKNLTPARTSVRTGVLIEPTVLERPKYQYKEILSETNSGSVTAFDTTLCKYFRDPITKIMRFSGSQDNTSNGKLDLLYGEFQLEDSLSGLRYNTLPSNLTIPLDVSYVNETNFIYPSDYSQCFISDLPDKIQFGNFGSTNGAFQYPEIWGLTTQDDLNVSTNSSGSVRYFIVKQWDKYTFYSKTGPYVRTSNRTDDTYTTNSIWLYKLISLTETGYNNFFYTSSKYEPSGSTSTLTENNDVFYISGVPHYFHGINTAKSTANQKINTIKGTEIHLPAYHVYVDAPYTNIAETRYFEVFQGYPRNHYTHKRMQFTPEKYVELRGKFSKQQSRIYVRSRQNLETTIDNLSGLEDSSLPIQILETSNVNLIQSDNVINQ